MDYSDYYSPEIIYHPEKWIQPQCLVNPFNPLTKLWLEDSKNSTIQNNKTPTWQPRYMSPTESIIWIIAGVIFLIWFNKWMSKHD